MPEASTFEFDITIEKLKRHKWPGSDQIQAEIIKAEGRTIRCEIHKLIDSIWNKKDLPEKWNLSTIAPIYKMGDEKDFSN